MNAAMRLSAVCAAAVLVLAGVARAGATSRPTTGAAEDANTLKGKLVKIDLGLKEIIVKTGGETAHEATLSVGSRTIVIVEGQNAALEDLKVGQKVTVTADNGSAEKIVAQKAQGKDRSQAKDKTQPKDKVQAKDKAEPDAKAKPKKPSSKKPASNGN